MSDFDDNRIALPDTEWTRMWQRINEIFNAKGDSFVLKEEVRMSEATAIQVKERETRAVFIQNFGAALGIPVTITDAIPPGKAQLWRNGKCVAEFDV